MPVHRASPQASPGRPPGARPRARKARPTLTREPRQQRTPSQREVERLRRALARAKARLAEAEATVHHLFDRSGDAIFLIDGDGRFVRANATAAADLGKTPAEMKGRRLSKVLPPAVGHAKEEAVRRMFRDGTPVHNVLDRFTTPDGPRWYDTTLRPVTGDDGRILFLIGVSRDITRLKEYEQDLVNYQARLRGLASQLCLAEERERQRVAAALHDELAQTLAGLALDLDTLQADAGKTRLARRLAAARKRLATAIAGVRTAIHQLAHPVLHDLELAAAVQWLVDQFGENHPVTCTFDDDGHPKPLGEDLRSFLFTATRELLTNVAKHARATGIRVALAVSPPGSIQLMVADNGRGLPPDVAAGHVKSQGQGFGLFSIRERARHLGGSFTCEPGSDGGTCVRLTLPLAAAVSATTT